MERVYQKDLKGHPFVVVEFRHNNSLGIVRNDWTCIKNKEIFAYWPPYWSDGKKLEKAICKKETANPKSWTLYAVTVIGDYKTYEEARKKMVRVEKSEESSSAPEGNDDHFLRRRCRKRSRLSECEVRQSTEGKNSRIRKDTEDSEEDVSQIVLPTTYPRLDENSTMGDVMGNNVTNTRHFVLVSPNLEEAPESLAFSRLEENVASAHSSGSQIYVRTPNRFTLPSAENIMENVLPTGSAQHIPSAGFNNQIIRKLHFLTATVNQIAESVHLLINRGLTQNAVVNFEKLFILPIETADGIQSLEKELKSAEKTRKENSRIIKVNEKKDALVQQVTLGGGTKPSDATYRALAELMTDDVAAKFSYEGRKGKVAFRDYPIINSALFLAIRRNCADARGSTIEEGIKYWLKKGPERLKRNQKKLPHPEESDESEDAADLIDP